PATVADKQREPPVEKPENRDGRRPSDKAAPASPSRPTLVPAGPATRQLARELGVDLARVPGSARGGRVTQEDVKAYVRELASHVQPSRPGGPPVPPLPDFAQWGPVERQPLDRVRRKTAEHMSLAWSQIPQVTQFDQADITDLEAFRRQPQGDGPKLTVTAFAIKAAAIALRQFPPFNASLDSSGNQLIVKQYYHVGVAVDT